MIYFITNRKDHLIKSEEVVILQEKEYEENHYDELIKIPLLGLDTETNGLDPYKNKIILTIIGTKENQYIFDNSTRWTAKKTLFNHNQWIGHNLKYDYKMIKIDFGIELKKMYDTMIVEQRLSQHYYSGMYIGYISYSLEEIIKRRLKIFENGMNKQVRNDFIGKNPDTFQCEDKHIFYAANDIKYLFDIKVIHSEMIKKKSLEKLIFSIELPLINVLAEAELEGWILNEEKWLDLAKKNKEKKFEHEIKLDSELRILRDNLLTNEEKVYLKNGKFDRARNKKEEVKNLDLFGEEVDNSKAKKIETKLSPNINYSSSDVLVTILGRLKQPVPTKDGFSIVPKFIRGTRGGYKIDKSLYSFTTGAGAIENYLAENPKSPIKSFISELISYRETCTKLNTFGENFVKSYTNPISGKVHTVFRQMFTSTGRLQSGSKRKKAKRSALEKESEENYFNSQNIPAEKEYRECFSVGKGYRIVSCDYSGCEAVVMIDKAKDEKFYEFHIKNDDTHSPLAQAVWRAIGDYKYNKAKEMVAGDYLFAINGAKESKDLWYGMAEEGKRLKAINISKKENKTLRDDFKPMTFGVCYGMGVKKAAKTLRISEEEAKIAIKTQKSILPKTFKFLDSIAKQASSKGYVVINNRTNSTVYYPEVLDAIKNKSELENRVKHEIESSARNITIQGTNADIVKEAMVELTKEFKTRNLDAMVIGSVHDEIIVKYNENINLIETNTGLEVVPLTMGEFVKHIMETVANRYLSFIKMKAEFKDLKTWTK